MASSFFKWLMVPVFFLQAVNAGAGVLPVNHAAYHPYFVAVTEINHNAAEKTLEISCKLFTDDFEKALEKNFKTKADLVHPPSKAAMDKLINEYLQKHLALKVDGKPVQMIYVGFEQESEAVFAYFQVNNIKAVKNIEVANSILQDLNDSQINIMHVSVNGNRKSTKLDYPKTTASFQF